MLRFILLAALVSGSYAHVILGPHNIKPVATSRTERIIGGVETSIEDVPYQVAMLYNDYFMCGGSIVNPKAVVSSSRCTSRLPLGSISIRAGSSSYRSGGQVIRSRRIFEHESFNIFSIDYDICIIELSYAITFSSSANLIALPIQGLAIPAGSPSQTSGWGYISEGDGPVSQIIRKVEMPIVDQDICNKALNTLNMATSPRMICAGFMDEGGKGPCSGDYGGPLVVDNTLVGITSWFHRCADPDYPTVFARVPEMRHWVDEKLSQII